MASLDSESLLYKRYRNSEALNGKLASDSIRLPDFSVNSGQFSNPEHVLFPSYQGWGIAAFAVKDVPGPIDTQDNGGNPTRYTFVAEHEPICFPDDPMLENYTHTEVKTQKNGEHIRGKSIKSPRVKGHLRLAISKATKLLKLSDI